MGSKPILFSYYRSSCAWRVRIALHFKGVNYEYRAINLIKDNGEQHSEEYKRINPYEQVPALVIHSGQNEETIVQSMAILEYLEEKYPKPSLLPSDLISRAKVRAICECVNSGIQPLQNLSILNQIERLGTQTDKLQWAAFIITDRFKALEKILKDTSGKFCYGDQITFADLCLVPQVYNAKRYKVDMTLFPVITRICNNLEEETAFQKAHPDQQPDAPTN